MRRDRKIFEVGKICVCPCDASRGRNSSAGSRRDAERSSPLIGFLIQVFGEVQQHLCANVPGRIAQTIRAWTVIPLLVALQLKVSREPALPAVVRLLALFVRRRSCASLFDSSSSTSARSDVLSSGKLERVESLLSLASNLGPLVAVNSGPSVAACWQGKGMEMRCAPGWSVAKARAQRGIDQPVVLGLPFSTDRRKRKLSAPVSMMCARSVMRPTTALHNERWEPPGSIRKRADSCDDAVAFSARSA